MSPARPALFDAHLHIVDPRFPLAGNRGYRPAPFTVADYRRRTAGLSVLGGAVVAGSFQGRDPGYLLDALGRLGPGFVGVVELPTDVPDKEVQRLDRAGVRAVRFNLHRGTAPPRRELESLARRVHELAGWHAELYLDAADLPDLQPLLRTLPRVSVDHLGLSRRGLPALLRLVERGAWVKASGFGRGDLDVPAAVRAVAAANPAALMVGTDLPSTRARRPFRDTDLRLVADALEGAQLAAAFAGNAVDLYRPAGRRSGPPAAPDAPDAGAGPPGRLSGRSASASDASPSSAAPRRRPPGRPG